MTRRKSREIIERIIGEGDLILLTPTSLGNGDSDGLTDMSLLLDEVDKTALLTGTSIAGALRNYLRERERGFQQAEDSHSICRKLFGYHEENEAQSCLIIDDARSIDEEGKPKLPTTELRDGVRIDGRTRTAYIDDKGKGSKFDIELLEAGTKFKLRFELLITQAQDKAELLSAFATVLQGFEKRESSESGEIHLGARKRRGYGECKVENWKVKYYNLKTKNGLLAWLGFDETKLKNVQTDEIKESRNKPIADAIKEACSLANDLQSDDNREYFELNACFALEGSMLIRSGSKLPEITNGKGQPDTVHLRSNRNGKSKAIVSGTSLAGVLRHRAVKICNTLKGGSGEKFVEKIFGVDMRVRPKDTFASRLEVKETEIGEDKINSLVQTRVKIDRFTSGAYEGALFDAAPVFAKDGGKAVELSLKLRSVRLTKNDVEPEADEEKKSRTDAEIGLLLLLLKDLWTSDLAIGGESSIGRGRLKGISASLHYRKSDKEFWRINLKGADKIEVKLAEGLLPNGETETKFLNHLVGQLKVELGKDNAKN